MKPLWPLKCEHNFEVPGCEICNRYPTLEAWLQSPECERVCERIEMGVARTADLLAATWTAATAQLCQRIERLEQQIRVEQQQVQLVMGKIAPSGEEQR